MKRSSKIVRKALASAMVLALLAGSGLATTGSAVIGGLTVSAATSDVEIVKSGSCGKNVTYTLDSEGTLTIEGTGNMKSYWSYGDSPFYKDEDIEKVVIKNGVTSIGEYVFYGCKNLTNITIPDSVKTIGDSAFRDCSSLTNITIPDSVKTIGDSAFRDCSSLTDITIPNSVTNIGERAFYGCSSLTNITIPNSVTSIGDYAFSDCSSLTEFNVNSKNKNFSSVNGVLFSKDKKTLLVYPNGKSGTSYTIPNSVTSIGYRAFWDCSSLTNITIPNSVTSIGEWTFSDCSSLTSITIPNSVTSIGYRAFWDCSSLTNITIPNSVTKIENGAFSDCSSLTNITIPNSVTSIVGTAFWGCSSLTSITIPDSVTSIGHGAFYACYNLTSITIPNSVTSIGDNVFNGCSRLTIYGKKGSYAEQYAKEENIPFKIAPLTADSSLSAESIALGKKVTLNGNATGGIGDLQYTYCYKPTNSTKWTVLKGYSTTTAVNFKPKTAGTYDICIKAKDSNGTVVKQYFKLSVLGNTSTISTDNIKLGEKVTLNGNASGSDGTVQYTYCYKKAFSTHWAVAKNYSDTTSVEIQPKHKGTYDVCIKAKDSKGAVSKKYFKVTVA